MQETIFQLSHESNTTVTVGIGYGVTVHSAEINAQRAIQLSKEKPEPPIVIVQENGTIIESVGEEDEVSFSYHSNDDILLEKLKKAKISLKNYNKLCAIVKKMGWQEFTIKDLAAHLYWDESNARRILANLSDVDLVEYTGKDAQISRGRPSKIYRLK